MKEPTVDFTVENPQGLNEIIQEELGLEVKSKWDKDLPKTKYVGKIKKEDVAKKLPGRIGNEWGITFEKAASSHLGKYFTHAGWKIKAPYFKGGYEYDFVAWKPNNDDVPDLQIEFHFPQPKQKYDLNEKVADDFDKLTRVGAKRGIVLIGVPQGKRFSIKASQKILSQIKMQACRFGNIDIEKRN